jgi:hypothetical protein
MQHTYEQYGMEFQWLTDDNFGLGAHTRELCSELIDRGLSQDIMWFMQVSAPSAFLVPQFWQYGIKPPY